MKKKDPTSHRIIEKRRRDRMNNCLANLSKLIPAHYMKKGHGRVEKTEIIEMAIKHLKDLIEATSVPQQHSTTIPHDHLAAAHEQPAQPEISQSANVDQLDRVEPEISILINSSPAGPASANHDHRPAAPPTSAATTTSEIMEALQQIPNHHHLHQHQHSIANHFMANNHQHNHHNPINQQQQQYQNHNNVAASDKTYRSSPTPSSNGSDSSSNSGRSSCSSRSICSIASNLSNGSIYNSNGCCGACGANMLNESSASQTSGNSSDGGSGGSNISRSHTAWYKKAWLVRSFSRAQQQRSTDIG